MNSLPANFPEISLLLALLLSVVFWNVVRLVLAALALGFVLLVMVGMAGYGCSNCSRSEEVPYFPDVGALRYGVPDTEEC
jgi:hypothetical protein